jgi:hypothetical protein
MPYAAKAQIEHEFDTDHLNIWLTFRNPMKQTVTPPLDTWLVKVDGTLMPATASVWQDLFTLLLTVPDVSSLPARVLVAYDGPDESLRTTWHKQWEPWGYIYSKNVAA